MTNKEFRDKIVEIAHVWAELKVPYSHRGANRKGCDCSGLLVGILQEMGFLHGYTLPVYERRWDRGKDKTILTRNFSLYYTEINMDKIEPGDVIIFAFAGVDMHSGIFIGRNLFIHCYQDSQVKIDTVMNSSWTARISRVVRFDMEKLV